MRVNFKNKIFSFEKILKDYSKIVDLIIACRVKNINFVKTANLCTQSQVMFLLMFIIIIIKLKCIIKLRFDT